jgi:S1-C subfamily serine protease
VFVAIFAQSFTSWAQKEEKTKPLPEISKKVYDRLSHVVVMIRCDNRNKIGSGSVLGWSKQGHAVILTASHVIAKNIDEAWTDPNLTLEFHNDIEVKIGIDSTFVPARVESPYFDLNNDLTLIETLEPVLHDKIIRYNHSKDAKPPQPVVAMGFPDSEKPTLTVGQIIRIEGSFLVFDADIAPGSSGGPLVDQHGRMIGLTIAKFKGGWYSPEGEGYARQMDIVLPIADTWLKKMNLKKIWRRQKWASFSERARKDPVCIVVEGGIIVTIGTMIYNALKPAPPDTFPPAPMPPGLQLRKN